jgi:hypothetical protein
VHKTVLPKGAPYNEIALISPLYEAVPPRLLRRHRTYHCLPAEALVQMDHRVTLFASADARTTATRRAAARSGYPAGSRSAEIGYRRAFYPCCTQCASAPNEFDISIFIPTFCIFLFLRIGRSAR